MGGLVWKSFATPCGTCFMAQKSRMMRSGQRRLTKRMQKNNSKPWTRMEIGIGFLLPTTAACLQMTSMAQLTNDAPGRFLVLAEVLPYFSSMHRNESQYSALQATETIQETDLNNVSSGA